MGCLPFHLVVSPINVEIWISEALSCPCVGAPPASSLFISTWFWKLVCPWDSWHNSRRLFYFIAAVENLVINGSDVSAFGKSPLPKQGFFLRPDRAFQNWWNKSGCKPIPEGTVIPVQRAMQCHPEAPRLWEKHINEILCELGLKKMKHKPCFYSGLIEVERLLFKCKVDDFTTASDTGRTS